MYEAIVVFSRKGLFKTMIKASDIRSREQARKLWPLIAPDDNRKMMVTWVSASFKEQQLRRRSHFRLMPNARRLNLKQQFEEEESERQYSIHESEEHSHAKKLIAAELNRRLQAGLGMPWWFKDESASDYPLEGNLLLGANAVVTEHQLSTPFGSHFRLDVAVLGPPVEKIAMTLGGVEIELSHAFDGRTLIGKSLGFPLISIDISEMLMKDITPAWAKNALTATTRSHEQGRRQTYIYLHDLLYPLYTQIPKFIDPECRHQYIVFADDKTLQQLVKWFKRLSDMLEYPNGAVDAALINGKSEQARIVLERAGEIVGSEWQLFNENRCLRLTVPRPTGVADSQGHRFHMTMARILLSHADALVGYKYANGINDNNPEEDIWIHKQWVKEQGNYTTHRVLPKRLADPVNRLMEVVGDLQKPRNRELLS